LNRLECGIFLRLRENQQPRRAGNPAIDQALPLLEARRWRTPFDKPNRKNAVNRIPPARVAVGLVVLALVPVLWGVALADLPSMREMMASKTADIIGVWILTWGLVWITTIAAFAIVWACWGWDLEAARDARPEHVDAA